MNNNNLIPGRKIVGVHVFEENVIKRHKLRRARVKRIEAAMEEIANRCHATGFFRLEWEDTRGPQKRGRHYFGTGEYARHRMDEVKPGKLEARLARIDELMTGKEEEGFFSSSQESNRGEERGPIRKKKKQKRLNNA